MDIDTHTELGTKAGIPLDAVVTHADMMRAFEAFKDANVQRFSTCVGGGVQDFDTIKVMKFAVL